MGTTQWKKFAVERLPIPKFGEIKPALVQQLEDLVVKRSAIQPETDPSACSELEQSIEELVFELYELNDEEIALIQSQG